MNRLLIGVVLAWALSACSSNTSPSAIPTTPPPTPSPAPGPTVAGERWNVTLTFRSFTGPDACLTDVARSTIGQPFSGLITIQRSGESIHLSVTDADDPSDNLGEYDGTVLDGVLTAAIKSITGQHFCAAGSTLGARYDGHVSGRFSADGRALTAEDVRSVQFSSGETQRYYYDWSASRE